MLLVPLPLYFVPYAYATVATPDHVVRSTWTVIPGINDINVACPSGDYAVSGGYQTGGIFVGGGNVKPSPEIVSTFPTLGGALTSTGQTPDGWRFEAGNSGSGDATANVWVVCQTPITVGGVSVPQFGSLYVAVALGAVVYLMLARSFTGRPAISTQA